MRLSSLFVLAQLSVSLGNFSTCIALADRGNFHHERYRQTYPQGKERHLPHSGRAKIVRNFRFRFLDPLSLRIRGGQTLSSTAAPTMADTTTNSTPEEEQLSPLTRLRRTVFPIYGEEVKKFFLISSIKFYIILALTLTRDTKDTLVVTQCGAEAIAFLKVSNVLYLQSELANSPQL